jgi:hypothetical protein
MLATSRRGGGGWMLIVICVVVRLFQIGSLYHLRRGVNS